MKECETVATAYEVEVIVIVNDSEIDSKIHRVSSKKLAMLIIMFIAMLNQKWGIFVLRIKLELIFLS